jgi:hypothetical protein
MSEPTPLRLSEWGTSSGPPPGPQPAGGASLPPLRPPSAPGSTSAGTQQATDDPADDGPLPAPKPAMPEPGFKPSPMIFQGFDLMRLPGGILRRWWLPVMLGVLGLGAGLLAGLQLFDVNASVSVRLMGRDPQSFAVRTTSYSPSRLQGATLIGALGSPQVAMAVAEKLGGGFTSRQLQSMIEVQEVRRTDFVDIVVTTRLDAAETAKIAGLWAQEALAFTTRLQAEESSEMKAYLEEQLRKTDAQIESVNNKLVALRESAGVIDVDKELEAYLKSLTELNLQFETNRVDLEALNFQLDSLRREIRKHSPSFEELKAEESKLQEMQEYYTDQNPIFIEARERVESLRMKVEREVNSTEIPLSDFTGTYVGNALYLKILELESTQENLILQQQQLEVRRKEARSKLENLPELAMRAGPLMETAESLRAARDILLGRLQEATAFEELAPGYYRLFKLPTAKDVTLGSRKLKLALATFFFGALFFAVGAAGAAGLEFMDGLVKTAPEAEAALLCRSLARVKAPTGKKIPPPVRSQDLWADVIGPLASQRVRMFWTPVDVPATGVFWSALLEAAQNMEIRVLVIQLTGDLAPALEHLPRVAGHQLQTSGDTPVSLWEVGAGLTPKGAREVAQKIRAAQKLFQEIWIVCSGVVREPAAGVTREFPETIMLCALGLADRNFWHTQRTLLTTHKPLRGVVTLG